MSGRFDREDLKDTAAAWVLGALPDDEAAAFAAQLAADPDAQAEVARLQPVADALGLAVPPAQPPPSLKANVMAIVEREAALLAAAGPEADRPAAPAPERRGRLARLFARPGLVAAACACALAIGIGIGIGLSSGGPDTVQHPVAGVQRWASVTGDVVQRGDHGELQLANVPRLPTGQVYKVWLMRDGKPVGDRAFTPDPDGTAAVNLRGGLHGASAVAISRETDPDTTAPTTTPIATASLA
jgi:anti-sigma-K factor RskA